MKDNWLTYLLGLIILGQCYVLAEQQSQITQLEQNLEDKPTKEFVRQGFRFVHFRLDEMQGSFDGAWQMAKSAWDMANPSHPPSELESLEGLSKEEIDSIWCYNHDWKQEELEYWRETGEQSNN